MHLLFLDESGQLAERKLFALGGIALRDSDWRTLHDLWQATLAEHRWPAEREVKWHGIRDRHPRSVNEEQGIYRGKVITMMGVLADINVNVEEVLAYIKGDDDEWEEEEEGDRPPDA